MGLRWKPRGVALVLLGLIMSLSFVPRSIAAAPEEGCADALLKLGQRDVDGAVQTLKTITAPEFSAQVDGMRGQLTTMANALAPFPKPSKVSKIIDRDHAGMVRVIGYVVSIGATPLFGRCVLWKSDGGWLLNDFVFQTSFFAIFPQ
jgi:hypothetical protein